MVPLKVIPEERPKVTCDECRGACCEMFSIPWADFRKLNYTPDAMEWLGVRGYTVGGDLMFECRCIMLTPDGRCSIYSTRPQICRDWEMGGADCLSVVRARRPELLDNDE